ncbi:AP-1 complex subunit beta-1 [Smittium culicis]|uniref:AP-1 complex subunit beta-1 n=1 Tax=Smittium culicis TaxID=133412 RepID=A0A1R1XEQ2_9FUNG|nr:AP-1 complex subunit beta-1 [Smittium culicis]OMJ13066.1 AP-1 complex subunit beta-1 [Smittium culicis]
MQKYPGRYRRILSKIFDVSNQITDDESKASLIWIAGAYIDSSNRAELVLKTLSENFFEEKSSVQLALLTALAKSFLSRKTKLNSIIKRLIVSASEKISDPDVRDRALFYSKLLTLSPEAGKKIVSLKKNFLNYYAEPLDLKRLESLLLQISTLSSVYFVPQHELFKGPKELLLPESPALVNYRFPSTNLDYSLSELDNDYELSLETQTETADLEQASPDLSGFGDNIVNYDPYSALADLPINDQSDTNSQKSLSNLSPFFSTSKSIPQSKSSAVQLAEMAFSDLINKAPEKNDIQLSKSSPLVSSLNSNTLPDRFSELNPLNKPHFRPSLLSNSASFSSISSFNGATSGTGNDLVPPTLNRYPTMPQLIRNDTHTALDNNTFALTQSSSIPTLSQLSRANNISAPTDLSNGSTNMNNNSAIHPMASFINTEQPIENPLINSLGKPSTSIGITNPSDLPLAGLSLSDQSSQSNSNTNNIESGNAANNFAASTSLKNSHLGLGISSNSGPFMNSNSINENSTISSSLKEMNYNNNLNGTYGNNNLYTNGFTQPNPTMGNNSIQGQKLLDSRQSNGLEIYGAFERVNDKVMLVLSLSNNSAIVLTDFALQFNLNTFGLVPMTQLQLPNNIIMQNQSINTSIELIVMDPSMIKPSIPLNGLQIALKCNLGEFYFAAKFSMHVLFLDGSKGKLEQTAFLQLWGSLNNPLNSSTLNFSDLKTNSIDLVKNKLNMNNVFTVAQRKTDNFYVFYLSCALFDNTIFVAEVKITFDFVHAQVITKSNRPDYNPSVCETISEILSV